MNPRPRSAILTYFSLFSSVGTLLCCALPSLLILFGLGAAVASFLSFMPWLVALSHHKILVFAVSGILILLSFLYTYLLAPKLQRECAAPALSENAPSACATASRFSKALLWCSAVIFLIGCFTAFILGPLLSHLDHA